jgi:acyl carrier protein
MSSSEVTVLIESCLNDILQVKGAGPVQLADDTKLLGGSLPIDSLDLAQLVLELQKSTGKDPFANGFVNFESAGELSRLFGS